MNVILTALVAMVVASTAQHLGLTEAIAGVIQKIASCSMCCTFWCCLAVLVFEGCDILAASALSLSVAYLSHWFGLLLGWLNNQYETLWQRINHPSRKK